MKFINILFGVKTKIIKVEEEKSTDTYIAKPIEPTIHSPEPITTTDNKDMYIQFLEERLNKIERRLNGTADYIQ